MAPMTNEEAKQLIALLVETAGILSSDVNPTPHQASYLTLRLLNAAKALSDATAQETDPEPPLPF